MGYTQPLDARRGPSQLVIRPYLVPDSNTALGSGGYELHSGSVTDKDMLERNSKKADSLDLENFGADASSIPHPEGRKLEAADAEGRSNHPVPGW